MLTGKLQLVMALFVIENEALTALSSFLGKNEVNEVGSQHMDVACLSRLEPSRKILIGVGCRSRRTKATMLRIEWAQSLTKLHTSKLGRCVTRISMSLFC